MVDLGTEMGLRGVLNSILGNRSRTKSFFADDLYFKNEGAGRAVVQVETEAGVVTLNSWFRRAGANVIAITSNLANNTAIIEYELSPIGE